MAWVWDEERTAVAKEMWMRGDSASTVSRALSARYAVTVSRNSVIGRITRCGFERPAAVETGRLNNRRCAVEQAKRERQAAKDERNRIAEAKAAMKTKKATPPPVQETALDVVAPMEKPKPPPAPVVPMTARPWITRAYRECAFLVAGDGADVMSCCARTDEKQSYCAVHRARMYTPGRPRRVSTEPAPKTRHQRSGR